MNQATNHYEALHSRIEQAISLLIAISEEKHIAALSNKQVADCASTAHSLLFDAGEAAAQMWDPSVVKPAGPEVRP